MNTAPDPELLTEPQAAQILGMTPANLRSHRERHEAGVLAERLRADQREALERYRREVQPGPLPTCLHGLLLLRPVDQGHELTQRGREVLRRLHRPGPRALPPPPTVDTPEGRRYRRADLLAWLDQHPEQRERETLARETMSTEAAARVLGIATMTLRSLRSKALRAQARLAEPRVPRAERKVLQADVDRCPPHVMVGGHKRYRAADLEAWAQTRGRAREAQDPLLEQVDPAVVAADAASGRLLTDHQACALMGIAPSALPGYRSRARKARRWLADHSGPHPDRRLHEQRQHACPEHVIHAGQRRYRLATVQAWVRERRG